MSSQIIVYAGLSAIAFLFTYLIYTLYMAFAADEQGIVNPAKQPEYPPDKQKVALEQLAVLWAKHQSAKIDLNELATVWREHEEGAPERQEREPNKFSSSVIIDFYDRYVLDAPLFSGSVKNTIEDLLKLLDREGGCPSVVGGQGEAESKIQQSHFDLLGKYTLAEHSIHTAEEIIKLTESGPLRPKSIIAALAHDIGKIPRFHGQLYSLGDHPVISVTVLDQIVDFKRLPYASDIIDAIKMHHMPSIDGKYSFAHMLKKADQSARLTELSSALQRQEEAFALIPELPDGVVGVPAPTARVPNDGQMAASRALLGTDASSSDGYQEKTRIPPVAVALPWLDTDLLLAELLPEINKENWGRWSAFSMPDGIVYVQPALIWQASKKLAAAAGDMTVGLGDSDKKYKAQILLSVVKRLAAEKNAVAYGSIKQNYYSGPFSLSFSDGSVKDQTNFTPLYAEAFGVFVSELESKKGALLRGITDVRPKC